MPFDAPFRLGPFLVTPTGLMEPSDASRFPVFHLVWRGYAVHARLDAGTTGDAKSGHLIFNTVIGRVPSTAGGAAAVNAERRARAFVAVRDLERAVNGDWRVSLLADHRVSIEGRRELVMPASAVALLTQVTCYLLDLAPYLDWLDGGDLAAPPGPSGIAGSTKI
jgi:hypothetical protein